jgi:hypothetical protein
MNDTIEKTTTNTLPEVAAEVTEPVVESSTSEAESQGKKERQASFLSRLRDTLIQEAKYTFTLPKPGEGLWNDLWLKATGVSAYVATGMFASASVTTEHGPDKASEIAANYGVSIPVALLGTAAILLANRKRTERADYEADLAQRNSPN